VTRTRRAREKLVEERLDHTIQMMRIEARRQGD